MPVFPEVGSMKRVPFFARPCFSASSTILYEMRSLIEPPGFINSHFASGYHKNLKLIYQIHSQIDTTYEHFYTTVTGVLGCPTNTGRTKNILRKISKKKRRIPNVNQTIQKNIPPCKGRNAIGRYLFIYSAIFTKHNYERLLHNIQDRPCVLYSRCTDCSKK